MKISHISHYAMLQVKSCFEHAYGGREALEVLFLHLYSDRGEENFSPSSAVYNMQSEMLVTGKSSSMHCYIYCSNL